MKSFSIDKLSRKPTQNPQRITAALHTPFHKYGFKWLFAKLQPAGEWLEKPLSPGSALRVTEKFLMIPRQSPKDICW